MQTFFIIYFLVQLKKEKNNSKILKFCNINLANPLNVASKVTPYPTLLSITSM